MSPFCNSLAVCERAAIRAHSARLKRRADALWCAWTVVTVAAIPAAYTLGMAAGVWVSA